jgi:NAD+ diphosphatase
VNSELSGAYLFQGNALLIPEDVPDALAAAGISADRIREAFGASGGPAYFKAPGINGGEIPSFYLEPDLPPPPGWRSLSIRQTASLIAADGDGLVNGAGPAGRLFRSFHLTQWRRDSAFCGSCGSPNGDAPAELARLCPACGRLEFPRISPAVIVLIIRGDGRALLAHNKKFASGVYSLIAGFTEAGENLESTVAREIREEVGLEVTGARYEASQPWPFPNSLMIGFTARYAGGDIKPDGAEIEDARWFSRDKLPELPGPGSVSRFLIDRWLDGRL